jgi:hypothetical protein
MATLFIDLFVETCIRKRCLRNVPVEELEGNFYSGL